MERQGGGRREAEGRARKKVMNTVLWDAVPNQAASFSRSS